MHHSNTTPEEHIATIRRDKFRIGPNGTSLGTNTLSQDLHRATEHLAEGLYSKDVHFILELIQNAEDNTYADGCKPELLFWLLSDDPTHTPGAEGALLIVNNEIGFNTKNVEALCAVGGSTKSKRDGYIGEKGIGFKSVFQVTDRPHLYSNGYQFYFQKQADPEAGCGYIVPYWTAILPSVIQPYQHQTCILLPLLKGKFAHVETQLCDISPEIILFLKKLSGLTLRINDETPIEVIRDAGHRPLVQFVVGEQYRDYWIVEEEVAVPSDLQEEKRQGVATRTLSVALPLDDLPQQEETVFAFLPTRVTSGLPFLVNADFILPASRESIHVDRPWNIWLRDSMAPAFVQAFEQMLLHPEYRLDVYRYIPLKKDIQESFFAATVAATHQMLRERAVIWTEIAPEPLLPACTRLASRAFRQLLDNNNLPQPLRATPLVHPELDQYKAQLDAIGVKSLMASDVLACLRDTEWLATHDPDWFVQLYHYLSKQSWATSEELEDIRLLLCEDGTIVAAAERLVYLPDHDITDLQQIQQDAPDDLQISMLSMQVCEGLTDDLVEWLEEVLSITYVTPAALCVDLAKRLNMSHAHLTPHYLIQVSAFIRDHLTELEPQDKRIIRSQLPVLLEGDRILAPTYPRAQHVYVTPINLDPEKGWQIIFAAPEDREHLSVLSDMYLAKCTKLETSRWPAFFKMIGATDAPLPRPVVWRWQYNGFWQATIPPESGPQARSFLVNSEQYSTGSHTVESWLPFEWLKQLQAGIASPAITQKQSHLLLAWLEHHHKDEDRLEFYQATYQWFYRTDRRIRFSSELKAALINAPWFPSTHGLKKPSEVFLNTPELRELFGDTVPYAIDKISDSVAHELGLQRTATADQILAYLRNLATESADQIDRSVVERVYLFLAERWRDDMRESFTQQALLLCQTPQPKWVTAGQAVWPDLASVFGDAYVYLETHYQQRLRHFFVNCVGVAAQLDDYLYAQAWQRLTEQNSPNPEQIESALERIYPRLLTVAKSIQPPEWWTTFCHNVLVWTQDDRFVPASQAYFPDDGDLRRLFVVKGVRFVWQPRKGSFSEYQKFFHATGVRRLSDEVDTEVEVLPSSAPENHEPFLTAATKRAICFYLWNTLPEVFRDAREQGLLMALLQTNEQTVERIVTTYTLGCIEVKDRSSTSYWDIDNRVLYCASQRTREQLEIDIPSILGKCFGAGEAVRGLEDFIGRVLGASEAKIDQLLRKHTWKLPQEEKSWINKELKTMGISVHQERERDSTIVNGASAEENQQDVTQQGRIIHSTVPETARQTTTESATHSRGESEGITAQPASTPRHQTRETDDKGSLTSRSQRGRFGTYVTHEAPSVKSDRCETTTYYNPVDAAGIERVKEFERRAGRHPESKSHSHPGYDIESADIHGTIVRYIEVKSIASTWGERGVGLTHTQFEQACRLGERYWLYVVERAESAEYHIHCIQNPARQVTNFYYDRGWQVLAEDAR